MCNNMCKRNATKYLSRAENCLGRRWRCSVQLRATDIRAFAIPMQIIAQSADNFDLSHPWCVVGCRVNRQSKMGLIFMRSAYAATCQLRIAKITVVGAGCFFRFASLFSSVTFDEKSNDSVGDGPGTGECHLAFISSNRMFIFPLKRNGMRNMRRDENATNKY